MKMEKWLCPECHSIARVVRRYKAVTYRQCKDCGTKYITKYVNGDIHEVKRYVPSTHCKYEEE